MTLTAHECGSLQYRLGEAYDSALIAIYNDGAMRDFHLTEAIRALGQAAHILGCDLVERLPEDTNGGSHRTTLHLDAAS